MFDKILLAVDGSSCALDAAKVAGNLARSENSKQLRILTVYDSIPHYLLEPAQEALIEGHIKESELIIKAAVEKVGKIPGALDTDILSGEPADSIIEEAKDEKFDLVVMGARGKGRLMGLLLGSHIHKVATHAPCPVLIVR
jgi:nucleotide-binding universal stress UspA family protein